jgi:hypothetical protein
MENSDPSFRQQVEQAPRLLGTEQSADPIEKREARRGEKNAGKGELLLLTRGETRAQVLLAVEFAVRRKQRIEAEQPQNFDQSVRPSEGPSGRPAKSGGGCLEACMAVAEERRYRSPAGG